MKPRTKMQFEVVELSRYIEPIYPQQREWAYQNCLEHNAYQNKSYIYCMDCGHQWKGVSRRKRTCICPNCNTKLKIKRTQKRVYEQAVYFAILNVCCGYQVVRYFDLSSYHKTKKQVTYHLEEILQQWIKPDGKYQLFGKRHRISWYYDCWLGNFEIREKNPPRYQYYKRNCYNLNPMFIHPEASILPELCRNGFKGCFHKVAPLDFILGILSDNRAETLLKMKQHELLNFYLSKERYKIDRFWDSIKICQRNKYVVKDATMWLDYLQLLEVFHRDLRSPRYVCPHNLRQEHDRYVKKKAKKDLEDEIRRKRNQIIENEERYHIEKARFFGLCFTDGEITIKPLQSVQEFLEEGEALHHCVFRNEYYKETDSLILSAKVDNKSVETVEVSLKRLQVEQSQGYLNKNSPYHERIVSLVKRNMRKIHKADISLKKQELVAV